ncbi:MAG TPA: 16S rRNA (cytosine(1402)-N(4))-methyltransferase RsmH [Saprospiraceae bacterium]|nr:16S rRNA (cytosine(1402)-N(4))-methyltransferase RsmH [Saprospiraceae bacterium]HMQ81787.1 16S rRNA (cytosine(1402)-N(4))-methyltransferase RsmH [Saprospiraceae bacterium]
MEYHQPVLATEAIEALNIVPQGIYVDATFGGGGHSALILKQLGENGKLLGFDQDEAARQNIPADERFIFVQQNFRYLKRFLRLHGIREVHGILADLGVSSHQLDIAERGFSYRFQADLDMRMNQQGERNAADVLNTYSEQQLQQLFSDYGQVRNAKTLAQEIVKARNTRPFKRIEDLMLCLDPLIRGQRLRYLSQVFQALRMEVNEEVAVLEEFLNQALEVLRPGGRLVIIAYHSVEDRIAKNFLKWGNSKGEPQKDDYGHIERPFQLITKKPIEPSEAEVKSNSRARSAKMRVGEKY